MTHLLSSWLCRVIKSAIIFLVALCLVYSSTACQNAPGKVSDKLEPITIGMESTGVNSLIFLAENQKFFSDNDLEVTIKEYPSGLAAVNGMLAGEVDIATAAEFVIVGKALSHEKVRAFGSIDKFMHNYLIGRKDRGIETFSDLEGKKVGLPLKTAAEFYLGRFLDLHGMNIQQVTLVNVSPSELVNALVKGDVDAVIAWQPNAKALADQLGDAIVQWPVQNQQATYCSLISLAAWTESHPELVEKFLKSLVQAEEFLARHPDDARTIIQNRLKYEDAYIATIWPEHQFQLTLDQSLILALEDEARWMINNNLTEEKQTPEFLNYVYLDGLEAVKPEAMNVIR